MIAQAVLDAPAAATPALHKPVATNQSGGSGVSLARDFS